MGDTIVTVRFTDFGEACRALRMLRLLGSEGQLRVRAAALVERWRAGTTAGPDDGEGGYLPQGAVIGTLVDALNGPVKGLLARPTDGFRADGAPWSNAGERALAVEEIGGDLEPEVTLVIAEVEDPDPDVLGSALDALGGSATQRSAEACMDTSSQRRAAAFHGCRGGWGSSIARRRTLVVVGGRLVGATRTPGPW